VDRLKTRAAEVARGLADDDIAVITLRRMEAEILLHALEQAVEDPADPAACDRRTVRHDLMNALGAIDNYAELIADDIASLAPEARAVRAAVQDIVARVGKMR